MTHPFSHSPTRRVDCMLPSDARKGLVCLWGLNHHLLLPSARVPCHSPHHSRKFMFLGIVHSVLWNQGYCFPWKTIIHSSKFILNTTMYIKVCSTNWPASSFSKVTLSTPYYILYHVILCSLASLVTSIPMACTKNIMIGKLPSYKRYLGIFNLLVKIFYIRNY